MKMEVDLPGSSSVRRAHSVFTITSTSDQETGALLDLAGEILRNHKLFAQSGGPLISTLEHQELAVFMMEILVDAPVEEIGAMNFELAEMVAHQMDAVPSGVVVAFAGKRV